MNNNFIGKVKMDFSAYTANDTYSDGGVENVIFLHVKAGDVENFLRRDNRWAVLCHLSPLRNFLVEWLPVTKDDTVLEIGCGLGALTGTLLKTGARVEAVELSPRRAKICAMRNSDADNLTIHVGNLNDMNLAAKFDFVVVVGVLEYAAQFTHTKNPYTDFLSKCKSFLKPDGVLVLAIENRLGIEYLSGKPDDHTGKIFDGIMDYPVSNGTKTFSRLELKNLLGACGFVEQKFFYPYPDYKFPTIIHSDDMLPTSAELSSFGDAFYDLDRVALFKMTKALPTIINAGLYPDLANAFLVVAGQNVGQRSFPLKIVANNCPRNPKYQLRTEIHRAPSPSGLVVKKIARTPAARQHLHAMVENCKIFSEIYGAEHVAQMKLVTDDVAEMEFIDGITFENYLCRALETEGPEVFVDVLKFYFVNILRGDNDDKNFPDAVIDFHAPNRRHEYDLTFRNIVIRDGNFVLFDYEFLLPTLPKKFVAWRAFKYFYGNCTNLCQSYGIDLDKLIGTLELSPEMLKEYQNQETAFWYAISDPCDERYKKKRLPVTGFKFD